MATSYGGKRVFITGGSSGIGRALAEQLVGEGASVVIAARGQPRIDDTVAHLRELAPSADQHVSGLCLDIAELDQINARAPEVLARLGGLDLLVNNAGLAHPAAFLSTPEPIFEQMMRVNYFGTVHVTRALLPAMIEQGGGGQIAIVSSLAGVVGIYGYTAYASSKFALRGLAQCLRQELLEHDIGVTLVFPPDTDTPQLAYEDEFKPDETRALAGTVKPLSAEFVAAAILAGLRRGRFHVAPGFATRAVVWAASRFPGLTRWFVDNDLRRFQARRRRELGA